MIKTLTRELSSLSREQALCLMVTMVKFGCKQGAQKYDNMVAILLEETQVCSSNVLAALCGAKLPSTFMTF